MRVCKATGVAEMPGGDEYRKKSEELSAAATSAERPILRRALESLARSTGLAGQADHNLQNDVVYGPSCTPHTDYTVIRKAA
jgi:hypothetical protein